VTVGRWKKVLARVVCILFVCGPVLQASAQQTVADKDKSEPAARNEPAGLSAGNAGREAKLVELPDSPGVQQKGTEPGMTEPRWTAKLSPPQNAQAPPSEAPAQSSPQKPVGTAAAEAAHTTGIAASQPAGVAMAPAKQHRVRTIVLRTGAIIAAGVAVGAVIALTEATSSKPPGAH
jgi:hypothetical protein